MRNATKLLLPVFLTAAACTPDNRSDQDFQIRGYAPVYAVAGTSRQISSRPAEATVNSGKIYAYQNYLFQVEQGKGIHVIDNSVPQQATKAGFITVAGCSEIAIKGGYLYINNINDLVVINIANPAVPVEVARQADAFPQLANDYPPFSGVYFECVDPKKGTVIGWEEKMLQNPKCRR